jgi:hypothetical protein
VWLALGPPLALVAFTGDVRLGLLGAPAALVVADAPAARKAVGLGAAAALLAGACMLGPRLAGLVFVQLHNLVALAAWWAWRPRTRRLHLVPLALFALGAAALLAGAAEPLGARTGGFTSSLDDLRRHVAAIAPGVAQPLALRLVLLFAFAQSVHYGAWLRLVPEEDRARPAPRPFAASFRALAADLGLPLLAAAALAALALAAWATFDLAAARDGYLRAAQFHGHLELGAGALLLVERRRRP